MHALYSDVGMMKPIIAILTAAFMLSVNSFANKELWNNAQNRNWKPIKKHLKHSPTAKEDLEWQREEGAVSVRGILLGFQDAIRNQNPKLYELLFSEQGLMPWKSKVDDPVVENFIVATKLKEMIDERLPDDADKETQTQKWVQYHQKFVAYNFSPEELERMAANYLDPEFQLFFECWAKADEIEEEFLLVLKRDPNEERVTAVEALVSAVDLPTDDEALVKLISYRLSDFSNHRILALAKKLFPAAFGEMTARIDLINSLES